MFNAQQINDVTRQWMSLTPQQREEIRRQNLRVQALIAKYQEKEGRQ